MSKVVPILRIARADEQAKLFNLKPRYSVGSNALNRNAYGWAAQEVVSACLGLSPIRINGNFDICFDAEREGIFYEIKSVRHGSKIVVYDWRLKKEISAGVPVSYAILVRKGDRRAVSGDDLFNLLSGSALEILILPANRIATISAKYPLRKIKRISPDPRNGYTRKGYKDGYYNLSCSDIRNETEVFDVRQFELYGFGFKITLRQNLSLNFRIEGYAESCIV